MDLKHLSLKRQLFYIEKRFLRELHVKREKIKKIDDFNLFYQFFIKKYIFCKFMQIHYIYSNKYFEI
jgi:hypothetical protein